MSDEKDLSVILENSKNRMGKSLSVFESELTKIRTGRASTSLVDHIRVDYYGTLTPLNQLATIAVPEIRTILIQPWDIGALSAIERAIMQSDLGINPANDGKVINCLFICPNTTGALRGTSAGNSDWALINTVSIWRAVEDIHDSFAWGTSTTHVATEDGTASSANIDPTNGITGVSRTAGTDFVDVATFDYRPIPNTGAITQEGTSTGAPTLDYDGNTWINASAPSRGPLNEQGATTFNITTPSDGAGTILISYEIADSFNRTVNITGEYSFNGVDFFAATEGTGGDSSTGVVLSSSPQNRTYAWDSSADGVGSSGSQTVFFRLNTSIFNQATTASFSVDNGLQLTIDATATGLIGRLVNIGFTITAQDLATVEVSAPGLPTWAKLFYNTTTGVGRVQGIPDSDTFLGDTTITINATQT